jgi:hypothetical protein
MFTFATSGTTHRRILAVVVAILLTSTGVATGQSDRDLREDNQRLQTQVNDMRRELDAARTRIAGLERELQALMRRVGPTTGSPSTTTQTQPERVSIDESVPNASPRALLRATRESYTEATSDFEIGDYDSPTGRRQRAAYLRAVESWAKRIQREMKSSVVWHIRMLPMAEQGGEVPGLRVRAVDPETDVELGDPFTIRLNSAIRRKLATLEQRGPIDVLVLKGVLMPRVIVNQDRMDPGPFNNPPLIGPFAEFRFIVTANSLTAPPKMRERP